MATRNNNHRDQPGGRIVQLLRPYTLRLSLVVGLLALLALANMALPFAVKLLIDDVFPISEGTEGNWDLLWFILPALGLIYVMRNSLFFSSRMLALRVSEDLCFSLRKQLFERLQQMTLRFYKSHQAGKMGSRVMDDTFKIQSFMQDKFPTLMLNLLMGQVLLVIIYVVNYRLAIATTVILPLHFLTYRFFRLPIRRSHSEAQEKLSTAYGNLVEKFLGMEVVKGFSGEERESAQFNMAIDASRKSQIKTQRYHFAQKVIADLLIGLGTVFLFGYGALEVMKGSMSGGTFFMYFGYVTMLYPAVLAIISGFGHMSRAASSVDRVYEILEEETREIRQTAVTRILELPLEGSVEFENVSFAYEPEHPILTDINLKIKPGERIAITGPSGSGKSTLIGHLPRFLDPIKGTVSVDGQPVHETNINELRKGIGIVFQEVFLFNTTIYENLRYANPDAETEDIVEACRLTGAHDFIQRLPDGYNTRLGASGGELSRGEKQRITLARALIKDPRILILDEATASIDSRTAHQIIRDIFEQMEGRTIIMVTHDTKMLDLADRAVCLQNHTITYDGPPSGIRPFQIPKTSNNEPPRFGPDLPSKPANDRNESVSSIDIKPDDPSTDSTQSTTMMQSHDKNKPSSHGNLVKLVLATLGLLAGCVSTTTTVERSVQLDQPRTTNGVMTVDPDEDGLAKLSETLKRWDQQLLEEKAIHAQQESTKTDPTLTPVTVIESEINESSTQIEVVTASDVEPSSPLPIPTPIDLSKFPQNAGRLIPLPQLSTVEITEIIDYLRLKLETENGYTVAGGALAVRLPNIPDGVTGDLTLSRNTGDAPTTESALRLGYTMSLSQPPQLWVWGVVLTDEAITVNPDIDLIGPAIETTTASITQSRQGIKLGDLSRHLIQLSYINPPDSMTMLKVMGVNTFPDPNAIPATINFDQLPIVLQVPAPSNEQMKLIGGNVGGGQFGSSVGATQATPLPHDVIGTPANELLVLYHPAHPEQYSHVRSMIKEWIDRPARQIFIEGMVLEINESGLNDLGIEWEFNEGPIEWIIGSMDAGGIFDTLMFSRFDSVDTPRDWSVQIRALIREGKAEVLSRPSVLTLNNRQAAIRVGEDIPIATSQEGMGTSNANRIRFDFKYLPTGIMLNIRPRVSEDGSRVNMLIDTTVSATVPGRDLEVRGPDGELLAWAPTISARRIQTYARVANNTPFIIGGLVSKDVTIVMDKVPILGDLPWVGMAFRSERKETLKREVIIVLTPYVLPEETIVDRTLPKDDELFDQYGLDLFRDAYRIRTEDVFDLAFLLENRTLRIYYDLANKVIERNADLVAEPPFNRFVNGQFPGEQVLVHRMIYEVVKRLDLNAQIDPERLIYFVSKRDTGGYGVNFLESTLRKIGKGTDYQSFFANNPGKALAITFHYDNEAIASDRMTTNPVPDISMIDCPDSKAWGRLLWELNQPAADGSRQSTILIRTEKDLTRLARAIMLKKIITLNGGQSTVSLTNFTVGKLLIMPEIKPTQAQVIDADVARYFFNTEHYYAETIRQIEHNLTLLDEVLRKPEIQQYLDGEEPPGWNSIMNNK